jgi:hypothetical protein
MENSVLKWSHPTLFDEKSGGDAFLLRYDADGERHIDLD